MLRFGYALLLLSLVSGCATARKLSQVGLREPASVKETSQLSELRAKIISLTALPASCPKGVQNFAALAKEKVSFPFCPAGFEEAVQSSVPYLKLEERSTMEEAVNSQCRSLGLNEFGDSLESMLLSFDTTGPIGRRSKITQTLLSTEAEMKTLLELRQQIEELVNYHLPLDRWARRNGEFVLPEEDLDQLHRMIVEKNCKMSNEEVDQAYRTIRSLEELSNILKDGPQEERITAFLEGMHQVIEKKLKEFFYP
jgi:hypothetical protein